LLVGFSQLYFGVHYSSDAVASYLAATLWVGALISPLVLWQSFETFRRRS